MEDGEKSMCQENTTNTNSVYIPLLAEALSFVIPDKEIENLC